MKKYNIGLDIGTTSVGWAIVETNNQKIIKKGNKRLWGVRLFEPADSAAERRSYRSTRRRYNRRKERIKLLQEEFNKEIEKVDKDFYFKLKESFYNEKDLERKIHPLSIEEKKAIVKYNKENPTIYHLRNKLIKSEEKMDIRLVYLALHHIIKYRGNFLYSGSSFNVNNLNVDQKLVEVFSLILDYLPDYDALELNHYLNISELSAAIMNYSKNDRKILTKKVLDSSFESHFVSEFIKMINGNKFDFGKMFSIDLGETKIILSLDGSDFDDKYSEFEDALGDQIEILNSLKELYDMIFLKRLFKGSTTTSISSLMVEKYNTHKKDLEFLKKCFDNDRINYNKLLRNEAEDKLCCYESYIHNKKTNSEFVSEIKKYLPDVLDELNNQELIDTYENDIQLRMSNGEFMPRITDIENGKYPYQLNKDELVKILEKQGVYYPFLLDKTNDGVYKIVKLLEFKIPYYVGPLTNEKNSPFAWMERKVENVKITPYNFDDVVNKNDTAEKFIKRMISKCTYLLDEPAIPSNSIMYSKYKVLNELKQIKICGDSISLETQHKIYEDLFLKHSGIITEKVFKEFIRGCSDFDMYHNMNITITGYSADKKFANNMQSYIDFFGEDGVFENTDYDEENAEEIIEWITIFEDKDILKDKIETKYSELENSAIEKILHKRYKGWSSLSKKLLTTKYYVEKSSGLKKSIIDLMYETKDNFMQIINDNKYNFQEMIASLNNYDTSSRISYKLVDNLATSPDTKRGIFQSLKVVDELVKYMGYEPEAISIEMARGDEKKQRKDDKKNYLLKLYENAEEQIENYNSLVKELNNYEKYKNVSAEKLFLYFIQEGKSLYSGKTLNIDDLSLYEVDHIIPRTLIKDDSIDNKALVFKEENQLKSASYVLPLQFRCNSNIVWWNKLKQKNLISAKKFHNLIRSEYKTDDISGFINRQLVETRQITKHVANILGNCYENSKIIYLPANLSHNYRDKYELFKFRDINDYHHAHDAYLAAVLGEYKEKFFRKNITFDMLKELNSKLYNMKRYKDMKYGYVINSLDNDINEIVNNISMVVDEGTGEILFDAVEFNKTIENNLYCDDILLSRKVEIRSGMFYKETINKKGVGNIELKDGLDTSMYGGYNNSESGYLILVEYCNKNKIIGIPQLLIAKNDEKVIDKYIRKQLKLKENEYYKIKKDKIPFDCLINYKNHDVYIKGYSSANNSCELSNAVQLKFTKENQMAWKHVLNKILNNKNLPKNANNENIYSDNEILNIAIDIYNELINKKKLFPLFTNEIKKIDDKINLSEMCFEDISMIIKELFKLYHCNSQNANLKDFELGDRIGRLSGKTIDSGALYNTSITGLKVNRYEF